MCTDIINSQFGKEAALDKNTKRNNYSGAFTIRWAREEAVGDRLIALVYLHSQRQ